MLCVLTAGPAVAQASSAERDETRRKQAVVKEQLALAKASDSKVETEVSRLNQAVADQNARVAATRQAEDAAKTQLAGATRQLGETERRTAVARQALAQHSVDAYVHPSSQAGLMGIVASNSFDEAGRRQVMLSVVQSSTADIIGQLRTSRQDQRDAADALEVARQAVTARGEAETRQASALATELARQKAARDQLDGRIRDLAAEGQALAAEQIQVEALLRARAPQPQSQAQTAPAAPGAAPAAAPAPRRPARGGGFIWPIDGAVTSEFGPRWGSFHPGLDIADPEGTPIAAAKDGVVVSAGPNGGYGNFVVIDHGGGFATAYAHQSRLAVSEGQQVSQGQTIGYVGSTGFSTGNHLHFEVRVDGAAQNPRDYL